jgi:hypothetical protein
MTILSVFCPTGSDRFQDFSKSPGLVDDSVHAPINYHAYAACMRGRFHKTLETISTMKSFYFSSMAGMREPTFKYQAAQSLRHSRPDGFQEDGLQQILPQISRPRTLTLLNELFTYSDGCISSTEELVPIYRSLSRSPVEFIPTPYPINDMKWDFSIRSAREGASFWEPGSFSMEPQPSLCLAAFKTVDPGNGGAVDVMNTDWLRANYY